MKKSLWFLMFIFISIAAFAVYEVGDIVDNYEWTDNYGETHNIHDLTANGKAVVLFWGTTG